MRQGLRVIDTDTHVNPSLDVLLRYADKALRDHMDDLRPYMRTVKPQPGRGDAEDMEQYAILSIKPVRYQRVAGEKPPAATAPAGATGFLSGRTHMVTRQPITTRVAEDNAQGRLQDVTTLSAEADSFQWKWPRQQQLLRQRTAQWLTLTPEGPVRAVNSEEFVGFSHSAFNILRARLPGTTSSVESQRAACATPTAIEA